jgi:hypothetical protein
VNPASALWRTPPAVGAPLVVASAACSGLLVANDTGLRVALALSLALPLAVIALRLPQATLFALVGWLVALGLVRRLVSGLSPSESWGDPLLLVGSVAWMLLVAVAANRGAFAHRTRLTNAVLLLWVLLAMSALNPLQGGLAVGLGGALTVVVPMGAFFVGRAVVDDRLLAALLWLVAWLGVVVAVYGLVQTFRGFPPWDETWVQHQGYEALHVGSQVRAFASFSAASEYAVFLGIAVVAWLVHAGGVLRWPLVGGAVGLLSAALWFESSRGIVVTTVAACALVLAARAGLALWAALLLGCAMIAAFPLVVSHLGPTRFTGDAAGDLARHQVEGLTEPFSETSTLPDHIAMVQVGITNAGREPLGLGIGSVTIAAGKYGGTARSAEADPGNAPAAAGVAGLLAYSAVVLVGFPRTYRLAAARRDPPSLAALGILTVTFLQWLNGGEYAVMFWPWLVMGWVDTASIGRRTVQGVELGARGVTT